LTAEITEIPFTRSKKSIWQGRTNRVNSQNCSRQLENCDEHQRYQHPLHASIRKNSLDYTTASYHLQKKIADLASVVKPRLAVIDGIIGEEGHEMAGKLV
jgi:hypothetical protein